MNEKPSASYLGFSQCGVRVLLQTLDTCPEGRGQSLSLSTCHNADGKVKVQRSFAVGETFLVLHSKAVLQLFPKQLQWMGTFFKNVRSVWKPWNPNRFQEVIWTRFKEEILI